MPMPLAEVVMVDEEELPSPPHDAAHGMVVLGSDNGDEHVRHSHVRGDHLASAEVCLKRLQVSLALTADLCASRPAASVGGARPSATPDGKRAGAQAPTAGSSAAALQSQTDPSTLSGGELLDELRMMLLQAAAEGVGPGSRASSVGWDATDATQAAALLPTATSHLILLSRELAACQCTCQQRSAALDAIRWRLVRSMSARAQLVVLSRCWHAWRHWVQDAARLAEIERERTARTEALALHASERAGRLRAEAEVAALRRAVKQAMLRLDSVPPATQAKVNEPLDALLEQKVDAPIRRASSQIAGIPPWRAVQVGGSNEGGTQPDDVPVRQVPAKQQLVRQNSREKFAPRKSASAAAVLPSSTAHTNAQGQKDKERVAPTSNSPRKMPVAAAVSGQQERHGGLHIQRRTVAGEET